jgi:hypothetical protein
MKYIPFQVGIIPHHWTWITAIMLKKRRGEFQVKWLWYVPITVSWMPFNGVQGQISKWPWSITTADS